LPDIGSQIAIVPQAERQIVTGSHIGRFQFHDSAIMGGSTDPDKSPGTGQSGVKKHHRFLRAPPRGAGQKTGLRRDA
jgi:hypothetical protein